MQLSAARISASPLGLFLGLLSLGLLAHCGESTTTISGAHDVAVGDSCTTHEDCIQGLVCVHDTCHQQCLSDSDCNEISEHCDETLSTCMVGTNISCGNGDIEPGEDCDDGNAAGEDGCDNRCGLEDGWSCVAEPSECSLLCGDGRVTAPEECDDGNRIADDGCSAECLQEEGWSCLTAGQTCVNVCGDGFLRGEEDCDDGNILSDDGCSSDCKLEIFSGGSFENVVDAAVSTVFTSNTLTISTDASVSISLSGNNGTATLYKNDLHLGVQEITYANGDTLAVRMQSAATLSTMSEVTVTAGGAVMIWSIRTLADDTPEAFTFIDVDDVEPSVEVISNEITIASISEALPFSVLGPVPITIIKNGVDTTNTETLVEDGDKITLNAQGSAEWDCVNVYTVTLGTYETTWTLTTTDEPCEVGMVVLAYTGADQTVNVPAGCETVSVKIWGAGGGGGSIDASKLANGGGGGYAVCSFTQNSADELTIFVGEGGDNDSVSAYPDGGQGASTAYGGGGGRSEVRFGETSLCVAGGGGGGGGGSAVVWVIIYYAYAGGAGGGESGLNGTASTGGTQSAGGSAGGDKFLGGSGSGSGGGGGYYGGGSGSSGSGGSGYINDICLSGTPAAGSGKTPPSTDDDDYVEGVGVGGYGTGAGGDGLVVIEFMD